MFPGSFFAPGPAASGIGIGDAAPTFPYLKMMGYSPGVYQGERVPAGVRTILVMVFGGAGNGFMSATTSGVYGSGGGGGFVMAEFPVTPGDLLPPIIVGGIAGTSSFGPYLTSTGGTSATANTHGVGGIGSFVSGLQNAVAYPGGTPTGTLGSLNQGGSSSGSPYGPGSGPGANNSGGAGWTIFGTVGNNTVGGNGLFACSDTTDNGPGGGGSTTANSGVDGGRGVTEPVNYGGKSSVGVQAIEIIGASLANDLMLIPHLRRRGGAGGGGINSTPTANNSVVLRAGNGGPGAGGGGIVINGTYAMSAVAGNGGIGGGGGGIYPQGITGFPSGICGRGGFGAGGGAIYASTTATSLLIGGDGGIGGGGGGVAWSGTAPSGASRAGRGGTGAVLIFYTEGY